MQRHVVIERGVYRARAKPVRQSDDTELPKGVGNGKPEQRQRREQGADGGHGARAEFRGQSVGKQTGHDRSERDYHRYHARRGKGHAQILMHNGPRRAGQRVGKSETDERDV